MSKSTKIQKIFNDPRNEPEQLVITKNAISFNLVAIDLKEILELKKYFSDLVIFASNDNNRLRVVVDNE